MINISNSKGFSPQINRVLLKNISDVSMKWIVCRYLENVYPELFVPDDEHLLAVGEVIIIWKNHFFC